MTPEEIVNEFIYLPKAIALKEWSKKPSGDKEELIAVAQFGLWQMALRWDSYCREREFDPENKKWLEFNIYLRCRGAIYDHLRKEDWLSRKDRTIVGRAAKDGIQPEHVDQLSGELTDEQRALKQAYRNLYNKPVSIEEQHTEVEYTDSFYHGVAKNLWDQLSQLEQLVIHAVYVKGLKRSSAVSFIIESLEEAPDKKDILLFKYLIPHTLRKVRKVLDASYLPKKDVVKDWKWVRAGAIQDGDTIRNVGTVLYHTKEQDRTVVITSAGKFVLDDLVYAFTGATE